jgi:hypothetical protein
VWPSLHDPPVTWKSALAEIPVTFADPWKARVNTSGSDDWPTLAREKAR